MGMKEDRILFQLIADTIANYFKEAGLDPIETMGMITNIAERVHTNLRTHVEIVEKED